MIRYTNIQSSDPMLSMGFTPFPEIGNSDAVEIAPPTAALPVVKDYRDIALQIKTAVCTAFKISFNDIDSLRKSYYIVRPRHAMFYLLRKHTLLSYPSIARLAGGYDHTTVMAGASRAMNLMSKDDEFARKVSAAEKIFTKKHAA